MKKALRDFVKAGMIVCIAEIISLVLLWSYPDDLVFFTVWRILSTCTLVISPVVLGVVLVSSNPDVEKPKTSEEKVLEKWYTEKRW